MWRSWLPHSSSVFLLAFCFRCRRRSFPHQINSRTIARTISSTPCFLVEMTTSLTTEWSSGKSSKQHQRLYFIATERGYTRYCLGLFPRTQRRAILLNKSKCSVCSGGLLLKVPLAMSVYLQAEQSPNLLKQNVFYAASFAPASEYFTAPTLAASSTYSVEQLIDAMIINSDNNAALLLTHIISTVSLDQSYSDLAVIVPQNDQYTMTVATYAGFFRVLYNATYLK